LDTISKDTTKMLSVEAVGYNFEGHHQDVEC